MSVAGGALPAQEIPSGWKVVKDRAGACQLAVPGDWTSDKLLATFVTSADGKANAVPHGARTGQSFADVTSTARQVMPPVKVIEESGKRLWYTYATAAGKAGTNWYVAVAGAPVCTAQVTFQDPATEETARKIALSLSQAK
jgi:hypothetical protein